MKTFFLFALAAMALFSAPGCTKEGVEFGEVSTPRTNPVPDELVGRWAIIGISGSTVYNIPTGSTNNTSEWLPALTRLRSVLPAPSAKTVIWLRTNMVFPPGPNGQRMAL